MKETRKQAPLLFAIGCLTSILFAGGALWLDPDVPPPVLMARVCLAVASLACFVAAPRCADGWIPSILVLWQAAIIATSSVVVSVHPNTAVASLFILPALFYLAIPGSFRAAAGLGLLASVSLFFSLTGQNWTQLDSLRLGFGLIVLNILLALLKARASASSHTLWSTALTEGLARDELAQSKRMLERTFDAVPIPVVVTEIESGRIIRANDAAERFTGFPAGTLIGRQAKDFYADASERVAFAGKLRERGHIENFQTTLIDTKGGRRTVQLAGSMVGAEAGVTPATMIASFIDRTDELQRLRQKELAQAEYRALFENAVVGIYRSTPDGRMLRANPALVRLNGYDTEAELIAAVYDIAREWYVEPDRRVEWMRLMREHGRVTDFVSEVYRHKSRERIWISENGWTFFDKDGEVLYYEGTLIETTERKQAEAEVERQALHDTLTGLPNRRLLLQRLDQALQGYRSDGTGFAVLCMDLDRFKPVNDAFGHQAGDRLLIEAAKRIQSQCREKGTIARVGGDEFILLVPGVREPTQLTLIAKRIIDAFTKPFNLDGPRALVGISVGIAICPVDGTEAETVINQADAALYRAKHGGRQTFRFARTEWDQISPELKLMRVNKTGRDATGGA